MPRSVSGKPVDSNGSITPAADGRSAHLRPQTSRLRNASRGACTKGSTARASSKLVSNRRQAREDSLPGGRAFIRPKRGGDAIGQRDAGARDPVVEPQHPHPPAVKHVMHAPHRPAETAAARRRVISAIPALDALEVRVERLRRRQPLQRRGLQAEGAGEEIRAARWRRSRTAPRFAARGRDACPRGSRRSLPPGHAPGASRPGRSRPLPRPHTRARDRSPAGTNACRRCRRAGLRRPAAGAHDRDRPGIARQDDGTGR